MPVAVLSPSRSFTAACDSSFGELGLNSVLTFVMSITEDTCLLPALKSFELSGREAQSVPAHGFSLTVRSFLGIGAENATPASLFMHPVSNTSTEHCPKASDNDCLSTSVQFVCNAPFSESWK